MWPSRGQQSKGAPPDMIPLSPAQREVMARASKAQQPDDAMIPISRYLPQQSRGPPPEPPSAPAQHELAVSSSSVPATTGQDKVKESIGAGSRQLQYMHRSVTIPMAHVPSFGPNGFGYYVKSDGDLLYYPVGEGGPSSLQEFSDLPANLITAMHQIMSIDLRERFNGDWEGFQKTARPMVSWLRQTDTDEGDRLAEALYRKAARELPHFQTNVPADSW